MAASDVATAMADADEGLSPAATPAGETESPAPADAPTSTAEGTPATPEAETPPASDAAPDTSAQPSPETPDGSAEPDLSEYPAFRYSAVGGEFDYPGAFQDDDGNVLFTPEAVQQLKHDLAYARAYPGRDAQAQRDTGRERKAREAAEASLQHVLGTFDDMVEKSQGAKTFEELAQTPLGAWLLDLMGNWPRLRADAMQRGFEIRSRAQDEELQSLRQREEDARLRPEMLGLVDEAVRHWGKEAGLSQAELDRLQKKYTADEMLDQLFPRAQQDDPVSGIKAGQRIDNRDIIRQELLFLHEILKGRTPQQATKAVEDENKKRLGQTGQKPPPMAGVGKGTVAPPKPKAYKNTREADADIWR